MLEIEPPIINYEKTYLPKAQEKFDHQNEIDRRKRQNRERKEKN